MVPLVAGSGFVQNSESGFLWPAHKVIVIKYHTVTSPEKKTDNVRIRFSKACTRSNYYQISYMYINITRKEN